MGPRTAASDRKARATGKHHQVQRSFGQRNALAAAAVLALLATPNLGSAEESATPGAVNVHPVRPAFTRAEEAYTQALWPIHGEIERTSIRVSLGKIFYTTNDIGKADLKARVDSALAIYRNAETRIEALQPPPSLSRGHEEYVAAVRLFERSAIETLKMFEDGNNEHLLNAFPLSQEGSNKIREIGYRFWQDEFPPN